MARRRFPTAPILRRAPASTAPRPSHPPQAPPSSPDKSTNALLPCTFLEENDWLGHVGSIPVALVRTTRSLCPNSKVTKKEIVVRTAGAETRGDREKSPLWPEKSVLVAIAGVEVLKLVGAYR